MALPVCLRGLTVINQVEQVAIQYHNSRKVTPTVVNLTIEQSKNFLIEAMDKQFQTKNAACQAKHQV